MSDKYDGNGKSNEEIFLDLARSDPSFADALIQKDTDLVLKKLEGQGVVISDSDKPAVSEALKKTDWSELGTLHNILGGRSPEFGV